MMGSSRDLIQANIERIPSGRWTVQTQLYHFALINYAVPIERLLPWIPQDDFEIECFNIGGTEKTLISIVPFIDRDFHFRHAFPWVKLRFPQTNHRIYVRHKKTGQSVVWFFGTTLGSPWVYIPRLFWKLPWHYGNYQIDCHYDQMDRIYRRYSIDIKSSWCAASIDLEDTGRPLQLLEGFQNYDDMKLVLTHPIQGFYYRRDGQLGGYSVWHREMEFTQAHPKKLYFSIYEKMKILSRDEMEKPHSVLLCPQSEFIIEVPPKVF